MRQIFRSTLFGLIGMSAIAAAEAGASPSSAEQLEMLDWSDPERAALLLDSSLAPSVAGPPQVEFLEVQGMVYADVHRDADVDRVIERLSSVAAGGDESAGRAAHYVRAYSLFQRDQYTAADAELSRIDIESLVSDRERYRFSILRGNSLRLLGKAESALLYLERGLDIAQTMHDDVRSLHAMLWLARIYTDTGNYARASAQLQVARQIAVKWGDEAALVEIEGCVAEVADRLGDSVTERKSSLAALDHAKRAGSSKWLAHALINVGDSYLKSRDFAESLKYSKQALPMVMRLRESGNEPVVRFNEGLAYIGLGSIKTGEKLAESAIDQALAGDNLTYAKDLLREYADALEHAGYLMMAIQVYHRYDEISEKYMDSTRQRAFLELSAKFDDERRARELELLRRDNALTAAEIHTQRLEKRFLLSGAFLVTCLCALLIWAFARVRKANDRLRFNSERDALTGLRNRRYFNEHVLTVDGARPVGGCVLLADLDHFKKINDTLGHPAGDAVLATVSQRLSAALRETDKLVRWGGEEFLAVLDPISIEQANQTVERLLQTVRGNPVLWNGHVIECTISIGYACFPMMGAATAISLDSAISLVDKALYEAKRRGRDRACLIRAMNVHDERELTIISGEFECAAADRRIHVVEMGAAA